ncbi:MAG: DUF4389 domain-containing protein [Actinomycetota bacterium]
MARPEFSIEYTAERNRLTTFFRVVLAIPHLIIENIGSQLAQVLGFFQWWVILVTGSRNEQLWKLQNVWLGFAARVYSYQSLMFDKWPNIGVEPNGEPTSYSFQYEKSARRLSNFFRLILVIPAVIVAIVVGIMAVVVTVIAWFAIVFTGTHPRGLFDKVLKVHRYIVQLNAYVLLMTDDYPKYGS